MESGRSGTRRVDRGALVEWSEAVTQHGEETRRLMIYTLHEERSERCIQAVKR